MNKAVKESINDILENFDFAKAHEVMSYLNWGWGTTKMLPPSESELKKEAEKLLISSYKKLKKGKKEYSISTGGLQVRAFRSKKEYFFVLEFILTEWDNFL